MTRHFLLSLFIINQTPAEVVGIKCTTDDQLEEEEVGRKNEEEGEKRDERVKERGREDVAKDRGEGMISRMRIEGGKGGGEEEKEEREGGKEEARAKRRRKIREACKGFQRKILTLGRLRT